jgi:hypothetical protein
VPKKRAQIDVFVQMAEDHTEKHKRVSDKDYFTIENWKILKKIYRIFELLYKITKFLENKIKHVIHNSV